MKEAFHRTICLERKRAERSRRSFLLVLLDLRTVLANDSSETNTQYDSFIAVEDDPRDGCRWLA